MSKSFRKQFEERYLDTYGKRLVFVIICLSLVALYIGWQALQASGPRPRRSDYRLLDVGSGRAQFATRTSPRPLRAATDGAELLLTRR